MLKIVKENIVNMDVDAVVNAANEFLVGGGGVDGAIHHSAGPQLDKACREIGHCDTGEAVITSGFNMKCKYIIHTVGPIYFKHSKEENKELLSSCYKNSIELALKIGIKSIAFPCISCGVYGYPLKEACAVAIDTCKKYQDKLDIYLVCFSDNELDVYNQMI